MQHCIPVCIITHNATTKSKVTSQVGLSDSHCFLPFYSSYYRMKITCRQQLDVQVTGVLLVEKNIIRGILFLKVSKNNNFCVLYRAINTCRIKLFKHGDSYVMSADLLVRQLNRIAC